MPCRTVRRCRPRDRSSARGRLRCAKSVPLAKNVKTIERFYRPYEITPEPGLCLLEQGIVCMGPATRSGCGALCPQANMGCRGCYGPLDGVEDQGARMLTAIASVLEVGKTGDTDADLERKIDKVLETLVDPAGTFYRFSMAHSILHRSRLPTAWSRQRRSLASQRRSRRQGMKRVTIDPITRLEGHGKIEIFLDEEGDVANAYFIIPELRGFEQFCVGRPAEEMPRITNRICGVCPEAHHMAATKALDALYHVEPPAVTKKLRELFYMAFYCTDHTTHFYALGGPDFVMGPDADPAERNILGVIHKVGVDIGKASHCLPHAQPRDHQNAWRAWRPPGRRSARRLERCRSAKKCARRLRADGAGECRVRPLQPQAVRRCRAGQPGLCGPDCGRRLHRIHLLHGHGGRQEPPELLRRPGSGGGPRRRASFVKYPAKDYAKHIAERVEPWTYLKFPYLKEVGWKGFVGGKESGIYMATPLSRLNAGDRMATPQAQEFFEKMYETLGSKKVNGRYQPIHHRLATHWARLIELLYAAERMVELATDPEITDPNVRAKVTNQAGRGGRLRGSPPRHPDPPLRHRRAGYLAAGES